MMKRMGALLLALLLAWSLTACGSQANQLPGSWELRYDVAAQADESFARGFGAELHTEAPLELVWALTLQEDGSFRLELDREETERSIQSYLQVLQPTLVEFVYQSMAELDMSRQEVDEAMAAEDTTVEQYVAGALSSTDLMEELLGFGDGSRSGYYRLRSGSLELSETPDFAECDSVTCRVDEDSMSWSGEALSELPEGVTALLWTRR